MVSFASGDTELVRADVHEEIRRLEPHRRHFLVTLEEISSYWQLRRRFRAYRIGLAPVLLNTRSAISHSAPRRISACSNENPGVQPTAGAAPSARRVLSSLRGCFCRGVPLDRIFLRPKWLAPWKRDRSVYPTRVQEFEGRPLAARRRRIAVLSPYFPYPLSHGGAVRIFHLLREMAEEFDIFLFAFRDRETDADFAPVLEHCARVILVRENRAIASRAGPPCCLRKCMNSVPEPCSPRSGASAASTKSKRVQVEYTMLAPYAGDVLVEHDVTFELYRQVLESTGRGWWDYWRWLRFEKKWISRYRRVVVMSEQDRALLGQQRAVVIPMAWIWSLHDPKSSGRVNDCFSWARFDIFRTSWRIAFSWRDLACSSRTAPEIQLTVVAGPDPLIYWREHTGLATIPAGGSHLRVLGFVADVRPLYVETNLAHSPDLGLGRHQSQGAGGDGHGPRRGFHLLRLRRTWGWNMESTFGSPIRRGFRQSILTLLDGRIPARPDCTPAGRAHAEKQFRLEAIGLGKARYSPSCCRRAFKSGRRRAGRSRRDHRNPGYSARSFPMAGARTT